jgi:hypothetical protein
MKPTDIVYSSKPILADSEFEMLRTMVYLYSVQRQIKGEVQRPLRPKLTTLLVLYMLEGYNRDAKKKAQKLLHAEHYVITSLNKEVRDLGYLIAEEMNTHANNLCPALVKMKEYYDICKSAGDGFTYLYAFNIKEDYGKDQKRDSI